MMRAFDVEGIAGLSRILVVAGHVFRQRPSLAFAAGFASTESEVPNGA